ncbi:hypothetical protein BS78_02G373000 [Paspalum vaginatum]|nr:hypothetical protein BS78_02G373000 [Paspalum vaginatum]
MRLESENEDKLSTLNDDILLSILGRIDIRTAVRISVLSTRWKHLPWLLHELTIDAKDFLPVTCPNPIEAEHMDKAMASLTEVARSFLATPCSKSTIAKLQLRLYLVNSYSDIIGPLVSDAINIGTVKDLDLAILDEKEPDDCYDEEMLQQARSVDGFFSAYPSVLNCLTRLSLYNIWFAEWDTHHLLFDCCKQLQHLYLANWKLEVICLPKLERLRWKTWICPKAPLSLYGVPSLKDLDLDCAATIDHKGFKLSEVLCDTTATQNLTLNFKEKRPKGKQLSAAFINKLKKLYLHGIFVEFDLLWTIVLIEAAPSVELFDLEITGFCPLEQQMTFLRIVIEQSPNLQTIVLNDYLPCEQCEKSGAPPRSERLSPECAFPKAKSEHGMILKQLIGDMSSCNVQILFGN